jgi:carbamoyltransferase
MSVILGINAFHAGASAAIVQDGEILYAVAEERLNRIKDYAHFPRKSILACLKETGLPLSDIDYIAVGNDLSANRRKKMEYAFKNPLFFPNLLQIKSYRKKMDDIRTMLVETCGVQKEYLHFQQYNIEHHLAHTASAFFTSGWNEACGITIDGSGDFVTCMMSACEGNEIKPIHRIYVPNSLGSFYTMICQFIGFKKYGDEGKVMDLAAFGKDTYSDIFQEMIDFKNGHIVLNPKYFLPFGHNQGLRIDSNGQMLTTRHYTDYVIEKLGPPREPYSEITQREMDLAFGLQHRFEEIYFQLLNYLHQIIPNDKVVMAGGCTLNSVANGKIFSKTPFKKTCIHPAADDEGLAIGAALYVSHTILKEGRNKKMEHAYLGGGFDEHQLIAALKEYDIHFTRMEQEDLLNRTVSCLMDGYVVGWFQGRSEWGPRALGNRSILCNPGFEGMKDILNAGIKTREWFRPFAPVVLEDRVEDVFEYHHPSPFMLHVYKIRENWRKKLSAVNHVDDTGRLQTVNRTQNRLCYDLIKKFEEKTGIPVLLNTSFNENEPIVETPHEAVDCFLRTKMDVLIAGPFFCEKL